MYTVATRESYRGLFKTANAALGPRVASILSNAVKSHPLVAAAIAAATAAAGGHVLGAHSERSKADAARTEFDRGMATGMHYGRGV